MKTTSRRRLTPLVLLCAAAVAARADELVLLDSTGHVRSIDTGSGFTGETQTLKGRADSRLLAIATNPATGVLYGLGRHGLCTVDASTGWTTPLGGEFDATMGMIAPATSMAGLDVDPATNELRALVPAAGQGSFAEPTKILRFDGSTGALIGPVASELPALAYTDGGPALLPAGGSIAHRADGTVLGIDPFHRRLFSIASPAEDGVLTTIAPLSGLHNQAGPVALEIVPGGTAYLVEVESVSFLTSEIFVYRLDLATAVATRLFETGRATSLDVTDAAVAPFAQPVEIRELALTKAKLSLDFRKPQRNALEIRGTLPEPLDGWQGKTVRVCIRPFRDSTLQINREFVLDRRGRSRTKTDAFSVASKARAGAVAFVLKLSRSPFDEFLIHPETSPRTFEAAVDALVDGRPFRTDLDLRYVPGKGAVPRRGVAVRVTGGGD